MIYEPNKAHYTNSVVGEIKRKQTNRGKRV